MKENAIIKVTVLGFNRTPMGLRLNTSPSLDVWVNSKEEYQTYRGLVGKEAEFTPRTIVNRAGKSKKVYDLNVTEFEDSELDALFSEDRFATAAATTEEAPY